MKLRIMRDAKGNVVGTSELSTAETEEDGTPLIMESEPDKGELTKEGMTVEEIEVPDELASDPKALYKKYSKG